MKLWRLMADYNAETTTYSSAAGVVASPYTPDFSGRLIALRTGQNRDAVTTLQNLVQFRLSCTTFTPNTIECGHHGSGLQTAPTGLNGVEDYPCDQPVKSGVPITIEARNITADTPVTVRCPLWGYFEVTGA